MKRLVFVYSATAVALVGLYAVTLDPVPSSPQAQAQKPIERAAESVPTSTEVRAIEPAETEVVLPIAGYDARDVFKNFGEFIDDRFHGYHLGDDIEYGDSSERIPVFAIADGTVVERKEFVSGYGGFILTRHVIDGKTITALYGHLDTKSVPLNVGDPVKKGQVIAFLGENESHETDGRRKHLHFGLYEGDEIRYLGYEKEVAHVSQWINPRDFFMHHGILGDAETRVFKNSIEPGDAFASLRFTVPVGMEVEYDPEAHVLNLFRHAGPGTARDRSQIIVRVSDEDASKFVFEKNSSLDQATYDALLESLIVTE